MKQKSKLWVNTLFAAGISIPLDDGSLWKVLRYKNIPHHKINFTQKALEIHVNKSSNPVLYPLKEVTKITSLRVKAKVMGKKIPLPEKQVQGEKGYDDFHLRVGLVEKGNHRMSWLERQLAPTWLVQLQKTSPTYGIKKVHYYTAVNQKELLGRSRTHPISNLIKENFISLVHKDGSISIEKQLTPGIDTLALWIATDGDDTHSTFSLLIEDIQINYK